MAAAFDHPLAPSYAVARERFLEAARTAVASLTHHVHPRLGRNGEELAVDVAALGPEAASSAVLVMAGTHGVEGYAGSALQHRWLTTWAEQRPGDVRVVLVHAFNPYGFSWVRRVNEDNVDLNRNFIDWSEPPPANEAYEELAGLLVPDSWTEEAQTSTTEALLDVARRIGPEAMQAAVSSGQYRHPTGLFYGGTGPVWSHRTLCDEIAPTLRHHDRLAIIDLHTGLGPWGYGELISHEPQDAPGYQRAASWWTGVRSMVDGESVSAVLSGDWLARIGDWLPDTEVTSAALEFGTVDTVAVLQALRADAWLHAHGDPTGPEAAPIRAQVRTAFADESAEWFDLLVARFDEVLRSALEGVQAS